MASDKQSAGKRKPRGKPFSGQPGPGRPKGSKNKTTALLKDAILKAAEEAGGEEGLTGYLRMQAVTNPGPFLTLLGKVLPMQIQANVAHTVTHMTDEQLEHIAASSSDGASAPPQSPHQLN